MLKKSSINKERLWETLMELGEIGKSPLSGGITRLSLTDEDLQARTYIINKMKDAGLDVRLDAIGNIIGKLPGKDKNKPAVLTGSHIDTVEQGGKFDGPLGVLAGIEALQTIKEMGIELTHSLEVISFTDEEGTRFGTSFIGSKGMVGELTDDHLYLKDKQGITYEEAYKKAGFQSSEYRSAIRKPEEIKAYVELHIEQGKVLDMENLPVGIVTDVQGPIWMSIQFKGQADHAGATPMSLRKDASLAMAEALSIIEEIAKKWEGVATVGQMHFKPGGINIIPETVQFSLDFRHTNKKMRTCMKKEIIASLNDISTNRGVELSTDITLDVEPVSCSTIVVQKIADACWTSGLPVYKMKSGAGHDALLLNKITDFGIIFVRSKEGYSHNPKEWSSKEDCYQGAQVLFNTLINLAK